MRGRETPVVAMLVAATLTLSCTSIVRMPDPVPNSPVYSVTGTRQLVRTALDSLGMRPVDWERVRSPIADTLSVLVREPPERPVEVVFEMREMSGGTATLRIVYIRPGFGVPAPSNEVMFEAFDAQVLTPLRAWLSAHAPKP